MSATRNPHLSGARLGRRAQRTSMRSPFSGEEAEVAVEARGPRRETGMRFGLRGDGNEERVVPRGRRKRRISSPRSFGPSPGRPRGGGFALFTAASRPSKTSAGVAPSIPGPRWGRKKT